MKLLNEPKIKCFEAEESTMQTEFYKSKLQWLISKNKTDTTTDYIHRIEFTRLKLEEVSGKKVKMRR